MYSLNILSESKYNKLAWDTFDDRVLVVVDMIYWLTTTDCQSGLRYISLLCKYLEYVPELEKSGGACALDFVFGMW